MIKDLSDLPIDQLLEGYLIGYWLTDLANFSALIFEYLPNLNWAGFYLHHPMSESLILGPFCGKAACSKIKIGNGVCGTAALNKVSVVVPNVHDFVGHIACDNASNSELVVPLFNKEELLGVFDLDSPQLGRFGREDELLIKRCLKILMDKNPKMTTKLWI